MAPSLRRNNANTQAVLLFRDAGSVGTGSGSATSSFQTDMVFAIDKECLHGDFAGAVLALRRPSPLITLPRPNSKAISDFDATQPRGSLRISPDPKRCIDLHPTSRYHLDLMPNLLAARVVILGTRPLLLNRFGADAIPLTKNERTGVAGNDPEEWRRRVCWTGRGQLFLEPPAVFACVRDGGRFTRKSRGTLQSLIVATLQVDEEMILIDRFLPPGDVPVNQPTAPVYIDVRGVRMKASGGRNVRYRVAAAKGWQTGFRLLWDKTILSRNELHAACVDAGKLVGIGDGRKIGMGRFEVVSFEVEDA